MRDPRSRGIRNVLLLTLGVHLAAAAAKIVTGLVFGLLSLIADGIHSVLDSLNNVIGLVGVASASRPADSDHPYGHRKFETFATLAISLVLGGAGVALARAALERYRTDLAPRTGSEAYLVVACAIVVDGAISVYKRRRGRQLASEFLEASAQDSAMDVMISFAVLGSMIGVDRQAPWLDIMATMAIAAVIVWTSIRLLLHTVNTLADRAVIDVTEIERIVRGIDGVRACHKIRTRGPEGHVFADLHIQVDPDMTVREGHRVAHGVVDALRRAIPGVKDVVTHLEPFDGPIGPPGRYP